MCDTFERTLDKVMTRLEMLEDRIEAFEERLCQIETKAWEDNFDEGEAQEGSLAEDLTGDWDHSADDETVLGLIDQEEVDYNALQADV